MYSNWISGEENARKRATSEYGKQYVASELKNIRPNENAHTARKHVIRERRGKNVKVK